MKRWNLFFLLCFPLFALSESNPRFHARAEIERVGCADWKDADITQSHDVWSLAVDFQAAFLVYDQRVYEFSGGAAPSWDTLHHAELGAQYVWRFPGDWGVWPRYVALLGFEDRVRSGSVTHHPRLVVFKGDRLTFYGGVGALLHPVDDLVYPVKHKF